MITTSSSQHPIRVLGIDVDGALDGNILHVAPCQVRPDLQGEGEDTDGERSGGTGTSVCMGALVFADIGSVLFISSGNEGVIARKTYDMIPTARARRNHHHRRTLLRVVRM